MLLRSLGTIAILGFGLSCPVVFAEEAPSQPGASTPPAATSPAPGASQSQAPSGGAAAQQGAASPSAGGAAPASGGEAASGGKTPTATATDTEKGKLVSPYQDFAKVADEGHKKFMGAGCNGCHGGGGGGGMGPPLTNQTWIYGKDDDTLFRLIALGSDGLKKQGFNRKGSENVVGPMPTMGGVLKSDDDVWKIIAWIRSVNPSSASSSSASAGSPPPPQ
jgi:mono/diheme cytochrome c family protein